MRSGRPRPSIASSTSTRLAPETTARGERLPRRSTASTAPGSTGKPLSRTSARFSSTAAAISVSMSTGRPCAGQIRWWISFQE